MVSSNWTNGDTLPTVAHRCADVPKATLRCAGGGVNVKIRHVWEGSILPSYRPPRQTAGGIPHRFNPIPARIRLPSLLCPYAVPPRQTKTETFGNAGISVQKAAKRCAI